MMDAGLPVVGCHDPVFQARCEWPLLLFAMFLGVDNLVVGGAAGEAVFFGGEFEGFFAVELGLADEFFDAVGEALRGVGLRARVGGSFRGDQEGDFATGGAFLEGSEEFGQFAAAEFFVELGDFARHAGAAIPENFARVRDAFGDTVWSFVENDGAVFDAQAFKGAAAFAAARRQEADEEKLFVG